MSNFFKLLFVNIAGLFDINKIMVARRDGTKSNYENRTVILVIAAIAGGYVLYDLLQKITFGDSSYYLILGFLISSLICFIADISLVEPIVFDNSDNNILFSLPVSKNQIVFSKLFAIYLKNIFLVIIIMFTTLLAYAKVGTLNQTMILLYIVCLLFIPFVPIIICTFFAYINDYMKVKLKKWLLNLIKYSIYIVLLALVIIWARSNSTVGVESVVTSLVEKISIIYPLSFLFIEAVVKESVLFFLLYILMNVLIIYICNGFLSNNILKISSMLQGINKNRTFTYKKTKNFRTTWGLVRKETKNLLNFRSYFINSFGLAILFFIAIIIGINMFDVSGMEKIELFDVYFTAIGPAILGAVNTLNVMTVSSISLEKGNMEMLATMPVSMGKVLFSKWLTSVLFGGVLIIIESLLFIFKFSLTGWAVFLWIAIPLLMLMVMSLTGLTLDYTFVNKIDRSDNAILRQRVITLIPTIISLFLGFLPVIINIQIKHNLFAGAFLAFLVVVMIMEVHYLFVNRKKLRSNLFN